MTRQAERSTKKEQPSKSKARGWNSSMEQSILGTPQAEPSWTPWKTQALEAEPSWTPCNALATPWEASMGMGTPWGAFWDSLGTLETPRATYREPGDALEDRPGARECLGRPAGRYRERLGWPSWANLPETTWRDLPESTSAIRALRLTFF